jgi:hypothetical protein
MQFFPLTNRLADIGMQRQRETSDLICSFALYGMYDAWQYDVYGNAAIFGFTVTGFRLHICELPQYISMISLPVNLARVP